MTADRTLIASAILTAALFGGYAGQAAAVVSDVSRSSYAQESEDDDKAESSSSARDLSSKIEHEGMSAAEVKGIQAQLPEYGGLNPAFVNNNTDPNLHLIRKAEISVTFIGEGAGYKNTFGYFVYDNQDNILYQKTIFANASAAGSGGTLKAGDTVELGDFKAGANIGFWLKADGFNNPSGYTYYTLDKYNPDGLRHMAIINDTEQQRLIVGIEDLYKLGDKDYNDIIFTFQANPYSAIDTSRIPTGAPEAGPMATAMIALVVMGLKGRKKILGKRA